MAKGENIFKRRDGRWEARYCRGRRADGSIRYGYCYGKSYREAKEKAARCRAELAQSGPKDTRRMDALCDEWLRERRARVKEATYIKYYSTIERHIKPEFCRVRAEDVTGAAVDAFAARLGEKGLAPKTVRDILGVLRGVLHHAGRAAPMHYPRAAQTEMRVLSREEQERLAAFLAADMDCCKFGVLLALSTGVRIGELCALRWRSIDVAARTVRIEATMQRLQDVDGRGGARTRVVIGAPKSEKSARTIPMTEALAYLCMKMQPETGDAYVLTGTERYMEPRALQYRMQKYTQLCGLEGVHMHTLRHTFATRAVEVGFELKSLSEVLGHANTAVTLQRYVHSSMALKRENMAKLEAAGF